MKVTTEEVYGIHVNWEVDGELLLRHAIVMDEERGQQTVLKALEQFQNESYLSWRKKRKRKNRRELHLGSHGNDDNEVSNEPATSTASNIGAAERSSEVGTAFDITNDSYTHLTLPSSFRGYLSMVVCSFLNINK